MFGKGKLPGLSDIDVNSEITPIKDESNESTSEVRVHREDGKYKKSIPIQLQGLSSQMLPPITKKKVAVYELIGADKFDPLTKEKVDVPPVLLPAGYTIFDPYERDPLKAHKYIKNVSRSERQIIDNVPVTVEVLDPISFNSTMKSVAMDRNYLLYVLLELHPLNESNKRRGTSDPAVFRRVDIDRRKYGSSYISMDLAFEAEKAVVDLRDVDTIMQYAHAAGIPTQNRTLDVATDNRGSIKHDLRIFARNNPQDFFKLNKRSDMGVKIAVLDAIELGLIDYQIDGKKWVFVTTGEVIGRVLPEENPQESLIKLLMKNDYKAQYEELQNQLNYWD